MCFDKRIIQLQRLFRGRLGTRVIVPRRTCSINWNQRAAVGDPGVGECKIWVLLDRLLKVAEGSFEVLTGAPVPKIATLEI